jgi:hypothetical protein
VVVLRSVQWQDQLVSFPSVSGFLRWGSGWSRLPGRFPGDRRDVSLTASRRGLVGRRRPSRCGLDRRAPSASVSLLFFFFLFSRIRDATTGGKKGIGEGNRHGDVDRHLFLWCPPETTGSETFTRSRWLVRSLRLVGSCVAVPPPPPPPHDLELEPEAGAQRGGTTGWVEARPWRV